MVTLFLTRVWLKNDKNLWSIFIPSVINVGCQMPELDREDFCPTPSYKQGSQNTQYKLGLSKFIVSKEKQVNLIYSACHDKR